MTLLEELQEKLKWWMGVLNLLDWKIDVKFSPFVGEDTLAQLHPKLAHKEATILLQRGKIPLNVVADRLGHKDPTVTLRIYGNHVLTGQDRAAADTIAALLVG